MPKTIENLRVFVNDKLHREMKFGNRTYKKLQKIYGSNESGLLKFVNQFDAFKNGETTLEQFVEGLKFSTPTELDIVEVLQRHLSPEDQVILSDYRLRIPTRPRNLLLRIGTTENAGFRLREQRTKSKSHYYISYVETNSRSAKCGLRVGDELLRLGAKFSELLDLRDQESLAKNKSATVQG